MKRSSKITEHFDKNDEEERRENLTKSKNLNQRMVDFNNEILRFNKDLRAEKSKMNQTDFKLKQVDLNQNDRANQLQEEKKEKSLFGLTNEVRNWKPNYLNLELR